VTASFKLGRIAGVEIGIHWSWAVIFGLIAWSLADVVFPETNPGLSDGAYAAMAIVAVLLFFTSLLLHELGHATRAAKEGMEIAGITLWLFGGIAQFRGAFPSAGAEFRIAIAGPIVSLAIGLLTLATALVVPLPAAIDGVVFWLGYINLFLLAFNMLPALPLDGGRVLRSALWAQRKDFLSATRTAAAIGQGFGQFLIAIGLLAVLFGGALGGVWLALIGWFLLAAAAAERSGAETHVALSGVTVADAMVTDPVTVAPTMRLDRFMELFFRHRFVAYPVVDGDQPVGLMSFRAALALPTSEWPGHEVREVMTPGAELPQLEAGMPLETAVEQLAQSALNRCLVIEAGRLAGLLSLTDATRVIEARRAMASPPGPATHPAARSAPASSRRRSEPPRSPGGDRPQALQAPPRR
jgi:Zn-dependent protease/CBS domain-containing protein